MAVIKKFRTNFVKRPLPRRGPFSSDKYNAMLDELSADFAQLADKWNNQLYPVLNSLPKGSSETRWSGATNVPDSFTDGLDGTTILVDSDTTSSSANGIFWDSINNRPKSIKEFCLYIDQRLSDAENKITGVSSSSSGLTDEQWNRLGIWVKDGVSTSNPSSTDGIARSARTDLDDLLTDIYNTPSTTLGTLTYQIEDMVTKLCQIHNGDWDTDPSDMDHSTITGVLQTGVDNSASYAQKARTYTPTDLEGDLNRIRYELSRVRFGSSATDGDTSQWHTDPTDPVDSQADLCINKHANYLGSGSASSSNPHGLALTDVTGLASIPNSEPSYTNTYVGKSSYGNILPSYSSTNVIANSDNLTVAVGKLDQEAGYINIFIGKSVGSDTPNFSSTNYLTGATNLEDACIILDTALYNSNADGANQLSAIRSFTGMDAPLDSTPDYSSTNFITQNASLETAVGELDSALDKHIRKQWAFSNHTNINSPVIINHNMNIAYPLVQVVDTGVGGDYGVLADENYVYEQEQGIVATDAFVSVEYINPNTFHVYTSIVNGVIVAVF